MPLNLNQFILCVAWILLLGKGPLIAQSDEGNPQALAKAKELSDTAFSLYEEQLNLAIAFLDSAEAIYRELGMESKALKKLGDKLLYYRYHGQYFLAESVGDDLLPQLDRIEDLNTRALLRSNIGVIKAYTGQAVLGFQLVRTSLQEAKAVADTSTMVNILEAMGNLYAIEENYEQALEMENQALALVGLSSSRDADAELYIYNNAGTYALKLGMSELAENYVLTGLEAIDASTYPSQFLYPYFTLGEIYMAQNAPAKAKEYFRKAGNLLDSLVLEEDKAVALEAKSMEALLLGRMEESKRHLKACLEKLEALQAPSLIYESLSLRSEILSQLGRPRDAYFIFQDAQAAKEQMFRREQEKRNMELQERYETEQAALETIRLKAAGEASIAENKRRIRFFVAIIILVICIGFLISAVYFRVRKLNRSLERQNIVLASQNETLTQLSEENELLMGIVAHDLKAPLSKIEALMAMLASGELSPRQIKALEMMEGVLQSGKDLVADILILSEAGQGRMPALEKQALNLVMENIAQQFEESAAKKSIHIELQPPAAPVLAWTHRPYLSRILDNLVSNAIKFSKSGTAVTLAWGESERGPWCSIQDRGPGIQAEEVPKLFQRFAKLANRPTAGESSTGLGLYIVKVLLEATQAEIKVETQVGEGTTFIIQFPPSPVE